MFDIFASIGKDKLVHYIIGSYISVLGLIASYPCHYRLRMLIALALTSLVAYGKEKYDERHPKTNTKDKRDFWWTVLGGLSTVTIFLVGAIK